MNTSKTWLKKAIVFLVVAAMAIALFPFTGLKTVTKAADPAPQTDAPAFAKNLYDNGDGTYTLSLSVTGKQDESIIEHVNKANVILVIDTSSSMYNDAAAGTTQDPHIYYTVNGTPGNPSTGGVTAKYYRLDGNTYSQVYYRNGQWRLTDSNNGTVFTGPFYSRSRFWAEYHALTDDGGIIDSLLSQNTTLNPDIIEIGIASFGGAGASNLDFSSSSTTNAAAIKNVISGLSVTQGTNWEEGLIEAHNIYNTLSATEKSDEQTYVVFLTDGQPTTHYNDYSVSQNVSAEFNAAKDNARTLVTTDKAEFYGVFTWGDQTYYQCVQSLVGFAYEGTGNYNTGDQGHADHVFNATSTQALIDALKQIADKITNNVGYTDAGIHDGVTSMTSSSVKASAQGDVTGLKYWRGGGSYGQIDIENGDYGTEWTEAPPATVGTDGVINWELGEDYDLEDGVTYTVTFVVWPKQDSLDLVADLNNGVRSYDSLTDDEKAQIISSGGKYSLKTNTDYPSVSYKTYTEQLDEDGKPIPGTRVESDLKTSEIGNPPPVSLAEEKLNALKIWEDSLDPSQRDDVGTSVTLYLKVDGHYYYYEEDGETPKGVTLQKDKNWEESDYISIAPGIMVTESSPAYDPSAIQVTYNGVKYALIEEGHDYVFEESATDKHFELTAYHHHPMIMGENTDGSMHVVDVIFTYAADGKTITGIEAIKELSDSLSATNTLKGGINITKKVVDESGKEVDDLNPFTVQVAVTDPDGGALPTKTATVTGEGGTSETVAYTIDYRIYYGPNNPNYDEASGGGRSDHIYATGTSFEETIYVGDTIRVVNVEDNSLYSVTETVPTGYDPNYTVDYSIAYGTGSAAPFPEDTDPSVQGNSASYAVVTNKYTYGDLEVSKVVEVENGDVAQAQAKEFEFTFKLYEDNTKAKELTGLKYSYTITDAAGAEVKGTITEGGTFKLKHGGKIHIDKLPEGAYYEITEKTEQGFTTTKTGDTGSIVKNTTASAAFTNTYNAPPVSAVISVVKNVTPENSGADDITKKFTFTLTAGSNTAGEGVENPMPSPNTVPCGADGVSVQFGSITFSKPGTYTYTLTESVTGDPSATSKDGISLDTTGARTVTVVVEDDGKGTLTATVNGGDTNPISFNNPYNVSSLDIVIPVEKILVVPEDLTGPDITKKYTFTIDDDPDDSVDSPLPDTKVLYNPGAKGGSMTFGEEATTGKITVRKPGTYVYTITETGTVAGVQNDQTATKKVTVNVVNNGDGTMSYTLNDAEDKTDDVTKFTNTYSAQPVEASFPVKKILSVPDELDGPEEWSYDITVTTAGADPLTGTIDQDTENGMITFGPFTYSTPGTYTYIVTESGTVEGVVNDPAATSGKTVTVKVVDGKAGALVVESINSTEESPLTFTNSYHETVISIPVNKTLAKDPANLEGPDITGKYTFTIADDPNDSVDSPLPDNTSVVNEKDVQMAFGPITFKEPGTYTYTATESGTVAGVTNDPQSPKTVIVKVTRGDDGELHAEYDGAASFDFVNTYRVTSIKAEFPVKKVMEVTGDGPKSWNYDITVTANDGAPTVATMTGTVTNTNDTVTFGEFEFKAPGTYTYTVTESGEIAGVTNDPAAEEGKTVTITVDDNKDGTLKITNITSTKDNPLTFTNTYTYKSTTATIQVHKDLVAENPAVSLPDITEQYTFELADDSSDTVESPMPESGKETVLNPAKDGGTAEFGTITYTEPGTYVYVVTETGTVKNVTNDPDAEKGKKVTVTVIDNQEGQLVSTVDYGDPAKGEVQFTNTFKVEPVTVEFPVQKILSVPDGMVGPEKWSYKIDVTPDKDGIPVAKPMTGTIDQDTENGMITFGPFTYDTPGTYVYTVSETGTVKGVTNDKDAAGKKVTVTVTDNKDGTLKVEATATEESPLTFTNTYNVESVKASFPVEKILSVPDGLDGPKDWSYTIDVTAQGDAPKADSMTGTVTKAKPTVTFGDFEFTKPGTFTYTVSETGKVDGVSNDEDAAGKTVTVEVVDNGDGTMKATPSVTDKSPLQFINTYNVEPTTADFPVQKILSVPEGLDGPQSWSYDIAVKADKEGTPAAGTMTGTVTKENDTVTFGPFTYDTPGTYTYTVSETGTVKGVTNDKDAAGKKVTVEVVDNGNGTLTATPSVTEESPLTFTNTYAAGTVEAEIPVEKILSVPEGRTAPDITGKFTFKLEAGANTAKVEGTETPMPKTTELTNPDANGGKMAFGKIEYKLPGEYTYTVTESGKVIGVVNDAQAEKTVKVTVTDNGDGTLSAAVNGGKPLQFTNDYKVVDLIIEKDISTYQHMEGEERSATIIFRVTATMDGWKDPVYDNYFSVTMTGADTQQIKLDGLIPEGADVTIEETYTGAGFDAAEGSKTKQEILDIKGTEAVKVSFENEFTDQNKGHGIENRYEYKDGKWQKPIQNLN